MDLEGHHLMGYSRVVEDSHIHAPGWITGSGSSGKKRLGGDGWFYKHTDNSRLCKLISVDRHIIPRFPNLFWNITACGLIILEPLMALYLSQIWSVIWVLIQNIVHQRLQLMWKVFWKLTLAFKNFLVSNGLVSGLKGCISRSQLIKQHSNSPNINFFIVWTSFHNFRRNIVNSSTKSLSFTKIRIKVTR